MLQNTAKLNKIMRSGRNVCKKWWVCKIMGLVAKSGESAKLWAWLQKVVSLQNYGPGCTFYETTWVAKRTAPQSCQFLNQYLVRYPPVITFLG